MTEQTENFKNMFREYDIRGRVSDDELNAAHVYLIINSYSELLRRRGIGRAVVGYDNREQSEEFALAAVSALRDSGIDTVYIGLTVSPALYFAQYHYKCEGGVMITASHNPNGWSGFKLACGYSKTLGPDDIRELYAIVDERFGDPALAPSSQPAGSLAAEDVREAYLEAIASRIEMGPYKPRVVIDAGNGGAGLFAYELLFRLGCLTFQLNCDPDVSYPHYFPNPSDLVERARLAEMVTHPYIHADLGIGFDGDGDRIGVIDENGADIWSDAVLALLAKQLLAKRPGATVVFDVKCSQALEETIAAAGGVPLMWKTGHSYIKSKMQEVSADLAGERSGHLFFGTNEYLGFDDALFAAAKLVELLSHRGEPLSAVVAELPQYVTSPEIKAHCSDSEKYAVVDELVAQFKAEYPGKVIDINGARVSFEHGWGLVRASSNLPELVLIFEADSMEQLLEIRQIFRDKLAAYPQVDPAWGNDIKVES